MSGEEVANAFVKHFYSKFTAGGTQVRVFHVVLRCIASTCSMRGRHSGDDASDGLQNTLALAPFKDSFTGSKPLCSCMSCIVHVCRAHPIFRAVNP